MTRIILHQVDSKLQAAEARTDARIVRIETMLQTHIQENKEFKKMAQAEFGDIRKHLSSLKLQAIALAATVIFGVAGFNSTLVSNVIGSYEMGQTTSDRVRMEVSAQTKNLAEEIAKLSDTINRLHLRDQHQTEPQEKRR